ncbi:MAG: trypsin-like peptidase domain-containing protein [Candidatus Bathyarchaeota archaeon]|jgi:S1-C subfamily serine protease|nr:trypsin-like peptidase domain-containing protein [Candidatus Bathyarchaeota archaeon]
MYEERGQRSKGPLIVAVFAIVVISLANVVGYVYTSQRVSDTVRTFENKVATLQNQISALAESLRDSNQTTMGNTSLSELYERVKDSVVLIRGQTASGSVAGSGFVHNYSSDSFNGHVIITNYHVVRDAIISVTFTNGHAYSATILGSDVYADLAVLVTEDAPPDEFKPLPIVSSSLLRVGDLVIALGNPYQLVGSMSTGIVSQLGRAVPEELAGGYSIAGVIQISAPINPGNSGGPLLNSRGQVVGVTFAIIENSTGVGFAIPSDTILREIASLVSGVTYKHSWIGAAGTDMTYELAQQTGTSVTYGWLVVEILPNSPAAQYGLETQDLIIAMNDTIIIGSDDLSNYLEEKTAPGQLINITVERHGSQITILLMLGERPLPN